MGLYDRLLAEHALFQGVTEKKSGGADEVALASSKDTAKHYSKGQDRWRRFSEEVINTVISHISIEDNSFSLKVYPQWEGPKGNSDFENLYRYCATKRAEIAKVLQHDPVDRFGRFRGETFISYEVFYGDPDIKQAWGQMQKEIFRRVIALVSDIPAAELTEQDYYGYGVRKSKCYEGEKFKFQRIDITEQNKNDILGPDRAFEGGFIYEIQINAPRADVEATAGENHNQLLSRITLIQNPKNPKQNVMGITYADTNKYNQKGDFNIANHHFKHLLAMKTDSKEEREAFLKELGRLNHLMAHLLPVKRGNAGICEWITRSIAFKKGIELGEFNRDEPLSWDFEALVTPDRETYAEWYASKAFLDMIVETGLEESKSLKL